MYCVTDARESDNENNNTSMTPTCLLDRRQDFLNSLLEITKDYHEVKSVFFL